MGKEESNKFGTPYKFSEPKDDTQNNPLIPSWASSMPAYYNSGSTSTPHLNPHSAASYFGHYAWPNQANSTAVQYDYLHDRARLSNSAVAGVILNQQQQRQQQLSAVPPAGDAASIFSEKVLRMFGGNNLDSAKKRDSNLQSKTSITKESREIENKCSIPNHDSGVSLSGASGSKDSLEGDGAKNDFPSSKKQQPNAMLGYANSEQNKNSRADLNATASTAQPEMQEGDEVRKERKRQSNRESAKRSRMRKQKECEELHRNMDTLKNENSLLTQTLIRLSEECLELNNENDSIQEELVEMYGEEAIADLLPLKPA